MIAMNDPRYTYQPWPAGRRAAASERGKQRYRDQKAKLTPGARVRYGANVDWRVDRQVIGTVIETAPPPEPKPGRTPIAIVRWDRPQNGLWHHQIHPDWLEVVGKT